MLFNTHVRIGNILHEWLGRDGTSTLNRQAFVYGHIKPDLERRGESDRHILPVTREMMAVIMDRLMGRTGSVERDPRAEAILLGELCHHVSDAFCRYHCNINLYPDFSRHFLYEIGLHRRFLRLQGNAALMPFLHEGSIRKDPQEAWEMPDITTRAATSSLFRHLEAQLAAYGEEEPSFDLDIRYALAGCVHTLKAILPFLRLQAAHSSDHAISSMPARAAEHGGSALPVYSAEHAASFMPARKAEHPAMAVPASHSDNNTWRDAV